MNKKRKGLSTVTQDQITFIKEDLRRIENKIDELYNLRDQMNTVLEQYGVYRKSLITLRESFQTAIEELEHNLGYTQSEINNMSAEEYREKILIPLGMKKVI